MSRCACGRFDMTNYPAWMPAIEDGAFHTVPRCVKECPQCEGIETECPNCPDCKGRGRRHPRGRPHPPGGPDPWLNRR